MNVQHHDKTFVVTFLAVLGFLGAFTVVIMIIANVLHADVLDDSAQKRLAERIKPIGQVITDEKMLLAVAPAATAARAPMSGAEIVTKVCGACHASGVLNAPKIGDKAAWSARGNLAALTASAIKGKNQMPARGGDPSLSDDEVKAAVQEMLK